MKYFKNNTGDVFSFTEEDVAGGWADALTLITEKERDILLSPSTEELINNQKRDISNIIQKILDDKSREFRYDNAMSVRSYTGFENPFKDECIGLSIWFANVWVKAGQIESDVLGGLRALPTVKEILSELPIYEAI